MFQQLPVNKNGEVTLYKIQQTCSLCGNTESYPNTDKSMPKHRHEFWICKICRKKRNIKEPSRIWKKTHLIDNSMTNKGSEGSSSKPQIPEEPDDSTSSNPEDETMEESPMLAESKSNNRKSKEYNKPNIKKKSRKNYPKRKSKVNNSTNNTVPVVNIRKKTKNNNYRNKKKTFVGKLVKLIIP